MLKATVAMTRKNRQASTARRLHRSLGAGLSIFIIFMVLTGLAINHSAGLGLDQRHASQPYLLDWYGLAGPENIHSFKVDNDWLSFAGSQVYLNNTHVATLSDGLGAVSSGDLLIAAGSDELLLIDRSGQLIERQAWDQPDTGSIESIGLLPDGHVVVKTPGQIWIADTQLLQWKPADNTTGSPEWSYSVTMPANIQQSITQQYVGNGLSLERVMLDLHSGRIFGSIGSLIYDLLALAVGFLAISGLVFWLRGRGNGKRNGSNKDSRS
jgi:hypothetical protein